MPTKNGQMTASECDAHHAFIEKRDAIIARDKALPPTHRTTRQTWHGCDIPAGTPLIASDELQAHFETRAHGDKAPRAFWFIIADGHGQLCHLWAHEVVAL
jgi:hypothetical protein